MSSRFHSFPPTSASRTESLQLDGAIDYKSQEMPLEKQLDTLAPDGVDFFFDNVGGQTLAPGFKINAL